MGWTGSRSRRSGRGAAECEVLELLGAQGGLGRTEVLRGLIADGLRWRMTRNEPPVHRYFVETLTDEAMVPRTWTSSTPFVTARACPAATGPRSGLLMGLYVAGYLLTDGYSALRRQPARYRRSLIRTAGPIVAAAAVLLAVTAGPALDRAEARALREASGPISGLTLTNEVERSDFRKLRRRFQDLHAAVMSTSRASTTRSRRQAMAD